MVEPLELRVARLRQDYEGWDGGTEGVILEVYRGPVGTDDPVGLFEIVGDQGETLDLLPVPLEKLAIDG